ncbi:MAG: hypothetical protein WC307_06930 [Candidatus Nanoarchaeia archaeon]|jgi:uncharacterized protein YoxC
MSDSASRYSIVERLTKQKLELLDEINNLKEDVKIKENEIAALEREISSLDDVYRLGLESKKREKGWDLDRLKADKDRIQTTIITREANINKKIEHLDKALED